MRLLELLIESTSESKLEALHEFLPEKKASQVKAAIEKLVKFQSAEVVYNVDYNEVKSELSRSLKTSLEAVEKTADWDELRVVLNNHWDINTFVQLNQTAKQIRALKVIIDDKDTPAKLLPVFKNMIRVNEAGAEVKKLLDSVKSKVMKGRRPSDKPVDPNAFHSKLGSAEAQKAVKEAIQKNISKQLDSYEKQVKDFLQARIDDIAKAGTYSYTHHTRDQFTLMLINRCFESKHSSDYKTGVTTYTDLKIDADGKKFAEKEAKEQRDGLEVRFLNKNLKKLSHIVDLKGNLSEIKELPRKPVVIKSGSGTIEAGFKFEFADGSEFTVINKIVTKYSYTGKPFEQFPTTFHDVIFPDKTRMKMPSEEKMVKEFGVKK